jgi:hypothetical protein
MIATASSGTGFSLCAFDLRKFNPTQAEACATEPHRVTGFQIG